MKAKDAEKLRLGDKVKILKSSRSYRYLSKTPTGSTKEIVHIDRTFNPIRIWVDPYTKNDYNDYLTPSMYEPVHIKSTKDHMLDQLAEINTQLMKLQGKKFSLNAKLEFLEEYNLEEFDEKVFKSLQVINSIDNNPNMSKFERAKILAEII